MPTGEILTVGTELTEGSKTNTNATWLAGKLTNAGIRVARITSVGDYPGEIAEAIQETVERGADVLVVSGGLGPTPDDKTMEAVSKAVGSDLILNKEALEFVKESYLRMHARGIVKSEELSKAREKMAHLPRGAKPLFNPAGAAPGVQLKRGGTLIVCLPGVPVEMQAIFGQHVEDVLKQMGGKKKVTAEMTVKEGDESLIAPLFDELVQKFPDIEVRSYPSEREVRIVLTADSVGEAEAAKGELSKLLRKLH